MTLFELVSVEYKGDPRICYYYADLSSLGCKLNDNQKKSISWLLGELNECVISQVRTYSCCVRVMRSFAVNNYIKAGLSENVRLGVLRRTRSRLRG